MLTPFQNRALRALATSPFFRDFDEECMRWIHRRSVRRGELLFEKGEPSDVLLGLVSGQLKRFWMGADGRQISFGLVGKGELAGAVDIADGAPRYASVAALAHSELAALKRHDLEPLLDRHPVLREALAHASAEAARQLSERIEDAAFLSIEDRVEKALADFARRLGERTEAGSRALRTISSAAAGASDAAPGTQAWKPSPRKSFRQPLR